MFGVSCWWRATKGDVTRRMGFEDTFTYSLLYLRAVSIVFGRITWCGGTCHGASSWNFPWQPAAPQQRVATVRRSAVLWNMSTRLTKRDRYCFHNSPPPSQCHVYSQLYPFYSDIFNPYPTAFPYGNGMVLHFYQQQESSTTKTVHKVINKGLKTYV